MAPAIASVRGGVAGGRVTGRQVVGAHEPRGRRRQQRRPLGKIRTLARDRLRHI